MAHERINQSRQGRALVLAGCLLFSAGSSWSQALNACDLNADGAVNVLDVQLAVDMDLGTIACTANVDGADVCNTVVVNRVITAALGGGCVVSHSVALNWSPSSSSTVVGYYVYRGTVNGGPYTQLNTSYVTTTSYTDSTVQYGTTYYYVVTAVDNNNNQSAYSNPPAQAIIPSS